MKKHFLQKFKKNLCSPKNFKNVLKKNMWDIFLQKNVILNCGPIFEKIVPKIEILYDR
jgi:hypothetical protein